MLRACSDCGGIHDGECPHKTKRDYRREHTGAKESRVRERKFRSSREWQDTRQKVLERDKHMCRVCLYDEEYISVHDRLDIHHIEPLHKAWRKRKTLSNLITLCKRHHYEADNGHISEEHLKKIISTPPTIGEKSGSDA